MRPTLRTVGTDRQVGTFWCLSGYDCGRGPGAPNVLDQHCESRQALERIADKWTCLVVYALVDGPRRHGELRRAIDGISQKMLTQTLRSMEADGLVATHGLRSSSRPPSSTA